MAPKKADVAIVLGNQVMPDGQPSRRLSARLDCAVWVYESGLAKSLIVSGGTGLSGFDEAVVMRDYLVARGIPAADIVVDSLGVDTQATATNARKIMQARNWQSAIAVSQFFHLPRTLMALRNGGVNELSGAFPAYFESRDLYSLVREGIALPVYFVRSKVF